MTVTLHIIYLKISEISENKYLLLFNIENNSWVETVRWVLGSNFLGKIKISRYWYWSVHWYVFSHGQRQ